MCGMTHQPTKQPAKKSGTAAETNPIVYWISLRVSPGMRKAHSCHSHTGAERMMPTTNEMRRRRSNGPVIVEYMRLTAALSPRCSATTRIGSVIAQMIQSVRK